MPRSIPFACRRRSCRSSMASRGRGRIGRRSSTRRISSSPPSGCSGWRSPCSRGSGRIGLFSEAFSSLGWVVQSHRGPGIQGGAPARLATVPGEVLTPRRVPSVLAMRGPAVEFQVAALGGFVGGPCFPPLSSRRSADLALLGTLWLLEHGQTPLGPRPRPSFWPDDGVLYRAPLNRS